MIIQERYRRFKSGIVKIMDGTNMTESETNATRCFRRPIVNNNVEDSSSTDSDDQTGNFASQLLRSNKKCRLQKTPFMKLEWVPAISCIAERAFSQSGLI